MKRGPCIWTWNLPDIGLKGFSPLHSPFTTMGSWLQQHRILPFVLIARLFVRSVGRWLVCRSVIIPSRAGSSFITYRSTCLSWVPPHHRTAWCNDILRRGPQHLNIFLKTYLIVFFSQTTDIHFKRLNAHHDI